MSIATIKDIEALTEKVNIVLAHDTSWDIKTGFVALCEQFEKFDNVFEGFSSDEEHSILEGYDFLLETEEGDQPFTIVQYYEDSKRFTVVC